MGWGMYTYNVRLKLLNADADLDKGEGEVSYGGQMESDMGRDICGRRGKCSLKGCPIETNVESLW